ncbi:MAG: ATP-binding cassette domain-containing protein [Desulfobacterales bacterium]
MLKTNSHTQPFITLDRITIRVKDRRLFSGVSWEIASGQHWAVIGPNGAGKTSLVRALAGQVPVVDGKIIYHDPGLVPSAVGYLSFESHQNLIAREEIRDDSRFFSGDFDSFLSVRQHLLSVVPSLEFRTSALEQVGERLEITGLLDRPVRRLSTGEIRRVFMAREILKSPRLLILDEPFEGLDTQGRRRIKALIRATIKGQIPVILVTHRLAEIPSAVSHILAIKNGRIVYQGKRPATLNRQDLERLYAPEKRREIALPVRLQSQECGRRAAGRVLIDMQGVTVRYGNVTVLDKLSWTVRAGENWAIVGPNGSGKTTLLSLVAGDNLQAYANAIELFGRRRGSGETIWDIKQHLGLVSAEFQIRYRKPLRAFEVVVSGFFDSVGLYRQASCRQCRIALAWMKQLGCADRAKRFFQNLSQGEQRQVLLARAMVKSPLMLILDEPCQGLDRFARRRLLDILDRMGCEAKTCLLYVTHYPPEIPACTTNVLHFEISTTGGYRVRQETLNGNRM